MPKKRPSEKPASLDFGPFGPQNLKQVFQFIDSSPIVPPDLRYDGLGALLMVATVHAAVAEQPPLEVLAGLSTATKFLREALDPAHARRKGYSDGAIRNCSSLVTRCVAASGVRLRLGRRRIPLGYKLQSLFDRLDPRGQMVLYPFMRRCHEQGLDPDDITQDVFERYGAYLQECVLRRNVRVVFTTVVRHWILARSQVPDWPQTPIALISIQDTYILLWSDFGDDLYPEVQRLMAAASSHDVTVRGKRKRINAVTVRHQTYQLRRIASALVQATGCDPKSITSVKQLVDPTAARTALRFLAARHQARQRKK